MRISLPPSAPINAPSLGTTSKPSKARAKAKVVGLDGDGTGHLDEELLPVVGLAQVLGEKGGVDGVVATQEAQARLDRDPRSRFVEVVAALDEQDARPVRGIDEPDVVSEPFARGVAGVDHHVTGRAERRGEGAALGPDAGEQQWAPAAGLTEWMSSRRSTVSMTGLISRARASSTLSRPTSSVSSSHSRLKSSSTKRER